MAWFDVTDQFFWDSGTGWGTWNGTVWTPNIGAGGIRLFFNNEWMDGQSPTKWRFTITVTSGSLNNTDDFSAYILDATLQYNWDSTLNFALIAGTNAKTQDIFAGGINSHLGEIRAINMSGRTGMVWVLNKIEFEDVTIPEPTYCCRLVKTDGRTEVTIPDPPNNPPVRVIPTPEIPGGRIPTPGGGSGGGIGNKPLDWGSEPISPPIPVGFTPWGGGNCNTCTITLLDLEQSGTSGIVIPQGCCQTIIIVE